MTLMFLVLCGFSFYLGGLYCSEKKRFFSREDPPVVQSNKDGNIAPLQINPIIFPECSIDYQDYTPCTDPRVCQIICFFPSFIFQGRLH